MYASVVTKYTITGIISVASFQLIIWSIHPLLITECPVLRIVLGPSLLQVIGTFVGLKQKHLKVLSDVQF